MAAPLGNRFWEARSSHGRAPIFASPDDLWKAATEYFEWVEANPLYEDKLVTFQGVATHEPVAKMRAMTIAGLCIFLDISRRGWDGYTGREDFVPICDKIEQVIRDQKFTGAAADLLNPSIIARDLGLADKQELTGKDGGAIEHVVCSPREIISGRIAGLASRRGSGGDTGGTD
jgi:hypothetical protein